MQGAASGTIRPGISRRRYSIIIRFRAVPPTIMTSRRSVFLRSSRTLSAIIRQSPAATRALGTPLLVAWVQSDLQKTEQRPERG
jgi:hypothetical protein